MTTQSSVSNIHQIKQSKSKIPLVMMTASSARIAELISPFVDVILVGDSLGMTVLGYKDTLSVDLNTMIIFGKAVVVGAKNKVVVVDMPFGSYEESPEKAFENASRLLKETGCSAVKLEGGEIHADTVNFLTHRGIPVMGHIGLQPQSVRSYGGFRVQGRTLDAQEQLLKDIQAIERAGAFSCVIEGVEEQTARHLTQNVSIPTFGIGASKMCDGQVLVFEDCVGLTSSPPKFAKAYADLQITIEQAVQNFANEVRSGTFPEERHVYSPKKA